MQINLNSKTVMMTYYNRKNKKLIKFFFCITIPMVIFLTLMKSKIDPDINNDEIIEITFKNDFNSILYSDSMSILKEMEDFNDLNNKTLSDIIPILNGTPYRSIVITTWRSGSTFFADLLNSLPGAYFFYEPLSHIGYARILRINSKIKIGIEQLKQLMNCNFTNVKGYIDYAKNKNKFLFSYNTRLWNICKKFNDICYNPEFLSSYCKLFPLQIFKILRLPLRGVEQLLEDEKLNVKVVYLVRDPRATMHSRYPHDWCMPAPDCANERILCKDLVENNYSYKKLKKIYPNNIK